MTAVFCHNSPDRSAASWHEQLAPFEQLEFAISDAAKGIKAGLDRLARRRAEQGRATPLSRGLDLFHTAREAQAVLGRAWRKAEAAWSRAEAIDAAVTRSKRQGLDARGVTQAAAAAWRVAIGAQEDVEAQEAGWRRARAALELFDGEGRLNDRVRAEAEIAESLSASGGVEWKTVRGFLGDRRSTASLDRMNQRLATAEPRQEWREAMAWRWWGRHRRPTGRVGPVAELVRSVAWDRRPCGEEEASYARVSAVLGDTVRASSAVECMDSVLRMQQSRHKVMTQPMLDLKRLYWNCHAMRQGNREGACPYQHLGLRLPSFDFWELLQAAPARLMQELPGQKDAP